MKHRTAAMVLGVCAAVWGSTGVTGEAAFGAAAVDGVPQAQPVTIRGVLVNNLSVEDPGRSGWYLQRPQRWASLDMSQAEQRPRRFQGQRVDLLGHWVRNEDGTRVFVVRRIRAV